MPWFKVDDTLAFHRKTIAAGNAAMGLWVRAGSWSAQQLQDGFIPANMVVALGGRKRDADRLVSAGLWERRDEGYAFWQWSDDGRQPTRDQTLTRRREETERKAKWRASRSVTGERDEPAGQRDMSLRDGRRDNDGTDAGTSTGVPLFPTRPDPTRPSTSSTSVVKEVSRLQEPDARAESDDDRLDLDKIQRATGGSLVHATQVAADITSRAPRDIADPTAYVLRAIGAEPERYRSRAPATTAVCPEHHLSFPCSSCEADRKAAS